MYRTESDSYQAYLLRIWRDDQSSPWRATLENTHTGSRQNFADVEQLIVFLQAVTGGATDIGMSKDR